MRGMAMLIGLAAAGWAAPSAQAKIFIINTGEGVSRLGDVKLPPELAMPKGQNKIGFVYSRFGIFWLDIWRWDGEYCLIDDKEEGGRISPEIAAFLLGVDVKDLPKPFWYRVPPGLLVIVVIGLAIGVRKIVEIRRQNAALREDPSPDYSNNRGDSWRTNQG